MLRTATRRYSLVLRALTLGVLISVLLTGCGSSARKPAGPDVRGLNLVNAEARLKKADVGYTEHAKDALFGIIIKSNFVVCSEAYVAKHEVRLEVAKDGC